MSEKQPQSQADSKNDVVPQLAAHNVTFGDLETACKVLQAVASFHKKPQHAKRKREDDKSDDTTGIDDTYRHKNLRPLRKALAGCYELHQSLLYQGQSEDQHYQERVALRSLKRQKQAEKDRYKNYIATTKLRQGRLEKLQAKKMEAKEEEVQKLQAMALLVPDGHVDTEMQRSANQSLLLENGHTSDSSRTNKEEESSTTNPTNDSNEKPNGTTTSLETVQLPCLRSCYVCKSRYRQLHHFYDQLCPCCASLNWEKRHANCPLLHTRVAIVTGARVKIGHHVVLKLLRSGCTVVATTRFPNACVQQFRRQDDFDSFQHRLLVYGLDLRDVPGLEAFTRFLKQKFAQSGIDILINNACQTIRRPAGYYRPLLEQERDAWNTADDIHKNMLQDCIQFERLRRRIAMDHSSQSNSVENGGQNGNINTARTPQILPEPTRMDTDEPSTALVATQKSSDFTEVVSSGHAMAPFEQTGVSHSAAMSQMVVLPEDAGVNDDILPSGVSDINGHQVDLRKTNSWLLKMENVSTPELMECMFVNAIAPFVLNSRLKPLMTTPHDRPNRYIVNVSAMEGKFYRYKTERHPHTNMAKAALNMLTRTSADDLARSHRIYMNSVDTGWINDENPLEKASKIAKNNTFQTPIDEIDAAARILDPIFSGVNDTESEPMYGKFLKDYRETEW